MDPPTQEQIAEWHGRLFRTALRLTGRLEDAADLTQETFCRAWAHWDRFDGRHRRTTWMHAILLNCLRDWHRRRASHPADSFDAWAIIPADEGDGPPNRLDRREQLVHLRRTIRDLAPAIRSAFVATVMDGYTYEEAAELLSAPVGTIGSRVHEARKQVKAAMRQRFPET